MSGSNPNPLRALVVSPALGCLATWVLAGVASAEVTAEAAPRAAAPAAGAAAPRSRRDAGFAPVPQPLPWTGLGSLAVGRGLRFNNPYRLATPLGDTAQSVSLAATYLDLGVALLRGERDFRHGLLVAGDVALQGIGQFVVAPAYLAEFGLTDALGLRTRLAIPIVVAPDATLGLEAGFGSRWSMAYGVGALAELVGSVYFGAATDETSITTIPMLSLQVGVFFEHGVFH